jgi:hypothetical protein
VGLHVVRLVELDVLLVGVHDDSGVRHFEGGSKIKILGISRVLRRKKDKLNVDRGCPSCIGGLLMYKWGWAIPNHRRSSAPLCLTHMFIIIDFGDTFRCGKQWIIQGTSSLVRVSHQR